MKSLTKCIFIVMCLTLLSSSQLFGQEWSAEQKEVWAVVETGWDLFAKGDLEGIMSTVHEDYSGWDDVSPLPSDKVSNRKFAAHYFKKMKVLIYDIKPVAIKVHGNVGIVHYYWSTVEEVEGKERNRSGRWTDIIMKEGDKWLLICDIGGQSAN